MGDKMGENPINLKNLGAALRIFGTAYLRLLVFMLLLIVVFSMVVTVVIKLYFYMTIGRPFLDWGFVVFLAILAGLWNLLKFLYRKGA